MIKKQPRHIFPKTKKAYELSINALIIILLAIIVALILIFKGGQLPGIVSNFIGGLSPG